MKTNFWSGILMVLVSLTLITVLIPEGIDAPKKVRFAALAKAANRTFLGASIPSGINTVISVNDTKTIKIPDQKFVFILPLLTKPCKVIIVMSIFKQRSQSCERRENIRKNDQ